ncbi:uncharacterized protein LOC142182016 [Nicotiana tabacum]|uniref:Uncharacterized protein LOC142182016 n=1 Tax=Nicotiana tabacum TaxID=4097 RepID=A0AC58UQY4_TOBAC
MWVKGLPFKISFFMWKLWKGYCGMLDNKGNSETQTNIPSIARSEFNWLLLRNEEGDLVYACGKEIQEVTNTLAETRAIFEALKHCLTNEMNNIWVETDSMLLKKVITREWKPPWVIEEEVKEIRKMLMLCNGRITHIFREGNKLADHFANYALDQGVIECHSFNYLDTQGRRLVNGDKMQCPFPRVKASRQ